MTDISPENLQTLYRNRFQERQAGRAEVWEILTACFFQKWIRPNAVVLDLGAGYGEFIRQIAAGRKLAVDANPQAAELWGNGIEPFHFDVTAPWPLPAESVDCVFTSNFFEHLPDKHALEQCVRRVLVTLRPGGILIAMGPNIRKVGGAYWDFFDHFIPLTEKSLTELLILCGFKVDFCRGSFLPYTMSGANPTLLAKLYPRLLRVYLSCPVIWPLFGQQFLLVASKPPQAAA
jgi:SAM-dependent methyltransferase